MFILNLESHLLRGDQHLDLTVVSFTSSRCQASLISASCPSAWLTSPCGLYPNSPSTSVSSVITGLTFSPGNLTLVPWSSPAPAYICWSTVLTLSHTHSLFSWPSLPGLYIPDQTPAKSKSVTLVSASLYILSRVTRSLAQASNPIFESIHSHLDTFTPVLSLHPHSSVCSSWFCLRGQQTH